MQPLLLSNTNELIVLNVIEHCLLLYDVLNQCPLIIHRFENKKQIKKLVVVNTEIFMLNYI